MTTSTFLNLLTPDINAARARLRAGLAAPAGSLVLPEAGALEAMLFDGVRGSLERLITPTLVLELNVARLRGELEGDTPEARFSDYVGRLADPAYRGTLQAEYPALFAAAAARLATWVDVSRELIARLVGDWPGLLDTFFAGHSPGVLRDIRIAQRTTKRGGRAVAILSFASGARLVYKPRSLAVEAHFQHLLGWLNARGLEPALATTTLFDRGSHGWMAWAEAAPCAAAAEVARFYRRQGAYLALLYALEATDFHLSNVIAAGEHPLLIDLEALFHPRDADPAWPPLDLALDALTYHSVLRVGLLPEPEFAGPTRFDIGGLTGAAGQVTPYTVPRWRERGTDRMRLVREPETLRGGRNLPVLGGRPVDAIDYLPALEEGFAAAYRLLLAQRPALLAADGPLARFTAAEVRVLPRSGQQYGQLLENSYHPDLLRRPDARAAYFTRKLHEDDEDSALAALVPLETDDLLAGDIPLFATRAGSRAVRSHRGDELPDFFPLSGLDAARRRIQMMSENDLDRQRELIRAAFATVADDEPGPPLSLRVPAGAPPELLAQLLAEATAIAEMLDAAAVRAGDEASWLGIQLDSDGHWALEPLDSDLYNGLPGVALFLAYLGAATGEARWTALARAAVATWRRLLAEERVETPASLAPLGLFDGLGCQLIALAHLAALWGDAPELRRELADLVEQARAALDAAGEDEAPGLASGLAGLLLGLLAADGAAEPAALAVAEMAGRALLRALQCSATEPLDPYDRRALFVSYLDGPLGAAAPLLELAALTGDAALRAAAKGLLDEATNGDAGLWPAYLAARPWLPGNRRARFDAALTAALPVLLTQETDNHSLGRGALGQLDVAWTAAVALNDPALVELSARHAAAVLDDVRRHGPRSATPLGVAAPGLMVGLAGIGYGLLRLAAPGVVPPALTPAGVWRFA